MLQRFESFKPRQLDVRKETPQGKKVQQENEQRKAIGTIELLSGILSDELDRPTDQFTELILKYGNFDLNKRPNVDSNQINIDDEDKYKAYVTVIMHPYSGQDPKSWLTTEYVIEVIVDKTSKIMRVIGHLPRGVNKIIPISGNATGSLRMIEHQIVTHYNSIKDIFVKESFEPRKVEDRRKKVEEQRRILESLVDYKVKFNDSQVLEVLPVTHRAQMVNSIREAFFQNVSVNEIAVSFTDEELEVFDKFETQDFRSQLMDQFLAVGDYYDFCKIKTQSDGLRYALIKTEELYVFKQDVDVSVLSKALSYVAHEL